LLTKGKYTVNYRFMRWISVLAVLALASLSCQLVMPAGPKETVEPLKIRFWDDFSDPESGWNRVTVPEGETNYADGMYRIWIDKPNMDVWAKAGQNFGDARLEVDAIKVGGERNNRFGIICRAVDDSDFYAFFISSDGYYSIGKIKGVQFELIGMQEMQFSRAIKTGSAINHLRADCIGSSLTFYVNGQQLAQVEDTEFSSGDVGLIAGTYETPGIDIRFDDFVVYAP
jgi:hypothetical protein